MENNLPSCTEQEQIRAIPWVLAANALNALFVFWTFGGSVFLLFLDALGLPKGQIGVVLSLFPFCGVLALGFAPVAKRWGWKHVFLLGYGIRKFVMALLLLLPWIMTAYGSGIALAFLFAVIIVFALLRALAETAFLPWTQEFTPQRLWGRIGGINTVLCTLATGVALWLARQIIDHGVGLARFQVLLGAGCAIGLLGVIFMVKVPGGRAQADPKVSSEHGANLVQALRDRNFVAFLWGSGCVMVGNMLFISFLPLYVKDRMGVTSGTVVMLDIMVMVGGALAGLLLGRATDRVGSRPVLMPAAVLTLLIPLGWLLLPRQIPQAVAWCATLYLLYGVASSGMSIAASRLLFNGVIPAEHSTAYTAIYYAWMGVTGGIAPLLAGALLSVGGTWQTRVGTLAIDSHSLLFLLAFLLLAAGWWLYGRVRPDDHHTTRTVIRHLLDRVLLR
jgi:Na+/melibiose symporter-like transporter